MSSHSASLVNDRLEVLSTSKYSLLSPTRSVSSLHLCIHLMSGCGSPIFRSNCGHLFESKEVKHTTSQAEDLDLQQSRCSLSLSLYFSFSPSLFFAPLIAVVVLIKVTWTGREERGRGNTQWILLISTIESIVSHSGQVNGRTPLPGSCPLPAATTTAMAMAVVTVTVTMMAMAVAVAVETGHEDGDEVMASAFFVFLCSSLVSLSLFVSLSLCSGIWPLDLCDFVPFILSHFHS